MSKSLVDRLLTDTCSYLGAPEKAVAECEEDGCGCALNVEAAAEIERLQSRIEELEKRNAELESGLTWKGRPWQSIKTAPKTFTIDLPKTDSFPFRIAQAEPIILIIADEDRELVEFRGCWSAINDNGCWWDLDAEEPVDWPLIGWRPVDPADEEARSALEASNKGGK